MYSILCDSVMTVKLKLKNVPTIFNTKQVKATLSDSHLGFRLQK